MRFAIVAIVGVACAACAAGNLGELVKDPMGSHWWEYALAGSIIWVSVLLLVQLGALTRHD